MQDELTEKMHAEFTISKKTEKKHLAFTVLTLTGTDDKKAMRKWAPVYNISMYYVLKHLAEFKRLTTK